ncbi:MAG TPA: N-acetylglutaminylglutamine amidotransferase [Woeseiaceae bacterium]|nr:N-acetylglutaminylglutamine amidotransferase [Woeseiaceae bacterium]
MCGIAGEIRFDQQPASKQRVALMSEKMKSRGPDDHGLVERGWVAFGHRRLKIVDLSDRAAQPMTDETSGCCIVFNGCIYNHNELRAELGKLGHPFRSRSDTEVILRAYIEWGKDCVDRFNGMFAFAIHDPGKDHVFLARDRLGIKPLYLQREKNCIRFASSLPALVAASKQTSSIDAVGLHHYMSFHSVVPAPRTILADVRKLPPASRVMIDRKGCEAVETWWKPSFRRQPGDDQVSFEEWRERTAEVLNKAVRRRLTGDVPVGVLLSGGLDSSLIVGLLAKHGQQGLQTFSVGFETRENEEGDEFRYSDIIAERFDTEHHQIRVPSGELLKHLPDCIDAMSEPMVSHDNIAFYLLSKAVSEHVKVVQSGQGADEIFAGYHWYPPMMDSAEPVADYEAVFFDRDHAEYQRAVNAAFDPGDASSAFIRQHFALADAERPIDMAMHLDTSIMLVEDPVKRVDNMTMAWGLEARVPFLDHEVVELAARIPPGFKVDGGGKYVLKELARKVIPAEVIDRPKGYFPVPELKYLSGGSLEFVKDTLNSRTAGERGLFRRPYIDELLDAPHEHLTPLRGSKLWQVALLEAWLQQHLDG